MAFAELGKLRNVCLSAGNIRTVGQGGDNLGHFLTSLILNL